MRSAAATRPHDVDAVWIPALCSLAGGGIVAWTAHRVLVAKLESRVERLENEMGDGDRGLRKRVHDSHNLLTRVEGRVTELEARRTRR